MKKQILIILMAFCAMAISHQANAQTWSTSGNSCSGTMVLGTTGACDVDLYSDNNQVGIITGATAPVGNYEIGIAGTLPQNKLLVETGAISSATGCQNGPYYELCSFVVPLGIAPSDVGVYSYSNNSSNNNVGVTAVADNSGATTGIGYVGLVSNASTNMGMYLQVTGSGTNTGADIIVEGDNANNEGLNVFTTGSSVENDGISGAAIGATNTQNVGVNGTAHGSTYSIYNNPLGNVGVYGSAEWDGVVGSVNTAVKGDANGDGSYNVSFMGNTSGSVSGSNGALNVGVDLSVSGNGNNSWGGPASSVTSWQANVGSYSGVYGTGSVNIGGIAEITDGGTDNTGSQVYGLIGSVAMSSAGLSQIGVWGYLAYSPSSSTINYGVDGDLSNLSAAGLTSGNVYYAVYGIAPSGTAGTNPGSLVNGTNSYSAYAGYFSGDVFSSGIYYYSDAKLKENIAEFSGALDKLNQLDIKTYTFNQQKFPTMNFPQGQQVGVLAEDLQKVFPTLVKHTIQPAIKGKGEAVDFDAVNYDALIPVLVEAVKELDAKTDSANTTANPIMQQQQAQIEALGNQVNEQNKQITNLTNMLNDICNLGCGGLQNSAGNNQNVVLFQSIPNPTSGNATIGYVINIPFTTASIIVTTVDGSTVKEFKITQGGKGSVNFEGNSFASSTFRYSLYIDGKLYDTKTIVMTKD